MQNTPSRPPLSSADSAGSVPAGVLDGVLAVGAALGAAHLFAAWLHPDASPLYAVSDAVVDAAPLSVSHWAIEVFGTNDKLALILATAGITLAISAWAGLRPRRLTWALAALAAVGALAALTRPAAGLTWALPGLGGALIGWAVAAALQRARGERPGAQSAPEVSRRRFGLTAAASAGVGIGAWLWGTSTGSAYRAVEAERAAAIVPTPAAAGTAPTAPPMPAAAGELVPLAADGSAIAGLSPFITPNEDFFRIDTALRVPALPSVDWSLRIHGLVERELTLSFAELAARPVVEATVTLACVSNPVGGDLIGTARWTGYRLAEILAEAGPLAGADMALSRSHDGFTAGSPLEALMDGRDALLAVAMNGAPLPPEHGYPVRMVVPGLYGFVSATKWVTDIEVTTFADSTAYWTRRGWSERGPIKTGTRIEVPRSAASVPAGLTTIAGVSWAPHRGISRVELRVDDGPWAPATLGAAFSADTWRLWSFAWAATPGRHLITARAYDADGTVQTQQVADVVPDGATGWPTRTVTVG